MTATRPHHRVAVIVAHADDEALGCGGTIKRHTLAGDDVWTIVLADGETSRYADTSAARSVKAKADIARRRAEAEKAAEILGVRQTFQHDFPDNQLDSRPLLEIIKAIERNMGDIAPDTVYTHHAGDVNIDHRLVHEAVVTICRPAPGQTVKRILFFETVSNTEWRPTHSPAAFQPNWFVDIEATLPHKLLALKCYDAEMRAWPHARSYETIEHLARWRGSMVGCRAAEAFVLGREIRHVDGD